MTERMQPSPATDDEVIERLLARRVEPTPEVRAAMTELETARARLAASLDDLTEAAQSSLDIPAKVRRHPLKTAAIVGGTGFLLAGGPKRVVRSVGKRIRRRTPDPYDGLLPPQIEQVLKDSGLARDPDVRRALNEDFAQYLRRKGKVAATEPNAARTFWRTFDRVAGPLGTAGARLMIQRLMEAEQDRATLRSEARARALDHAQGERNRGR